MGKMAELALKSLNIESFVFWDNSVQMLETFDVITAIQVLHYFHENERSDVISRSYKALSSPGIFISFENFAPYSETGKQILLNRWKKYQLSQGGSPIECDKHIARYGKAYFPITISEHLQTLHQCGFKNAEIIWVSNLQAGFLGIK